MSLSTHWVNSGHNNNVTNNYKYNMKPVFEQQPTWRTTVGDVMIALIAICCIPAFIVLSLVHFSPVSMIEQLENQTQLITVTGLGTILTIVYGVLRFR